MHAAKDCSAPISSSVSVIAIGGMMRKKKGKSIHKTKKRLARPATFDQRSAGEFQDTTHQKSLGKTLALGGGIPYAYPRHEQPRPQCVHGQWRVRVSGRRRILMRDNRNRLLEIKNDANLLAAPNLAPMVPSETAELANAKPNSSVRSNSRLWNGAGSQPLLRSLGEEGAEGVGEPTHFKSFPDGTLIETVRDQQKRDVFRLLVYKNENLSIVNGFERDGDIFVPREIDRNLAQYLRLGTGVSPCGQPRELFSELVTTIREYLNLPDHDLQVISAFVLCSWFPDRLQVAPYLWLVGPLSSGKTTILKLLQALCRRAFLVGDLTPASLYQLPNLLSPTLLIDENDLGDSSMSATIRHLLRIGSTPNMPVIRNGRSFDTYCVKVLASREPPSDAALGSRSIIIGTSPSHRQLVPLDEATIERIALAFQPKLLMFRLQNFHNLHVSDVFSNRIDSMTPRIRDIARAIAIPLLGDTTLETDLIDGLGQQDCDARVHQSLEPEWLVVEALFALCHPEGVRPNHLEPKACALLVGGISKMINHRMSERGEDVRLTAKRTGLVPRALGIRTKLLGKLGRGIELTSAVREKVHKLSQQFGFNRRSLLTLVGDEPDYGGAPCALCTKYGLTGNLKFVALRDWKSANPKRTRRNLLEGGSSTTPPESF
jgi:hypothetical protein